MNKYDAIKLSVIILICTILTFSIISCIVKKPIAPPTKIIIYNYGTKTELTKNNPKFNKIVKFMNKRINANSSIAKIGIPKNWESYIKDNNELGIEFIYPKEQNFGSCPYTRLFFPIKGNYENLMFFSIKNKNYDGYHNGPIGLSPCSKELLDLLKDFK